MVALPQNREQRILLEPRGSRRLSSQTLLDLRLSRAFRVGRLGRLELLVDLLNALNDTAEEGIVTDALTTASIPRVQTFGMPNVFVDPRRAMVGMRIDLGRHDLVISPDATITLPRPRGARFKVHGARCRVRAKSSGFKIHGSPRTG